jgi:hypothetical protein
MGGLGLGIEKRKEKKGVQGLGKKERNIGGGGGGIL